MVTSNHMCQRAASVAEELDYRSYFILGALNLNRAPWQAAALWFRRGVAGIGTTSCERRLNSMCPGQGPGGWLRGRPPSGKLGRVPGLPGTSRAKPSFFGFRTQISRTSRRGRGAQCPSAKGRGWCCCAGRPPTPEVSPAPAPTRECLSGPWPSPRRPLRGQCRW